jgi:chemotaxis protein MotB
MLKKSLLILISLFLVNCVSNSTHEELQNEHDKLAQELKSSQAKIEELETLVAQLEQDLGKASRNKKSLSDSIQNMKDALQKESERKQEVEKRLAEFRKLISRFKRLTDAGQLSIKIRDGRMVVVLPSDVLFKSGSARLSTAGQETIQKVAQVLMTLPDKQFQVEGHTDNVPIRSAQYPSNWELASTRALNVVRIMLKAGLPATNVSAASFGQMKPIASNETKEGKAMNRRIDIVVVPDLSQLPGYEELQRMSAQ